MHPGREVQYPVRSAAAHYRESRRRRSGKTSRRCLVRRSSRIRHAEDVATPVLCALAPTATNCCTPLTTWHINRRDNRRTFMISTPPRLRRRRPSPQRSPAAPQHHGLDPRFLLPHHTRASRLSRVETTSRRQHFPMPKPHLRQAPSNPLSNPRATVGCRMF
jgi:hypothetical protein